MNTIKIQQTGGFPLETDTIDRLQTNLLLMQAFGELAGNLAIVTGAVTTGGTVSDGVVFINGEILEFRGGAVGPNVIISEEKEQRIFEDGTTKDVFITRFATFGTATTSWPWADFSRPDTLIALKKQARLVGEIIDWFGNPATVPTGWAICNGTNGTPDLMGRVTVGFDPADPDYNAVGNIGGQKNVVLTEQQMPMHTHGASIGSAGSHSHTLFFEEYATGNRGNPGYDGGSNNYQVDVNKTTNAVGDHTHAITINNTGGGQAHENRQPYVVMLKLMWKGV